MFIIVVGGVDLWLQAAIHTDTTLIASQLERIRTMSLHPDAPMRPIIDVTVVAVCRQSSVLAVSRGPTIDHSRNAPRDDGQCMMPGPTA
jgi:hypothetical protein